MGVRQSYTRNQKHENTVDRIIVRRYLKQIQNRSQTYGNMPESESDISNHVRQFLSQSQTHRSGSDKSVIEVRRTEIYRTYLRSESDV